MIALGTWIRTPAPRRREGVVVAHDREWDTRAAFVVVAFPGVTPEGFHCEQYRVDQLEAVRQPEVFVPGQQVRFYGEPARVVSTVESDGRQLVELTIKRKSGVRYPRRHAIEPHWLSLENSHGKDAA